MYPHDNNIFVYGDTNSCYKWPKVYRDTILQVTKSVTIYYDDELAGVNATCTDWPHRNEYFHSMSELKFFIEVEYSGEVDLVEITSDNYPVLCAMGVFNEDL